MDKKTGGYTLLEIIVVLAIIGGIMMTAATYTRKKIEDTTRQALSNALAQEISGLLKFANQHELYLDNQTTIINPLYDAASEATYKKRTSNSQLEDDVAVNDFFRWSDVNSERGKFRDSRCSTDGGTASAYRFANEFITCKINSLLESHELRLERVDIVGDSSSRRINRIDFFVGYYPIVPTENISVELYLNNLEKAFKDINIPYSAAFYIERKKNELDKARWNLMKATNNIPIKRIDFGNMSENLARFDRLLTTDYGIRFSFIAGDGQYLKSDGSIGADKLCWNASKKISGPCLKGNPNNDNQLILSTSAKGVSDQPAMCWDSNTGGSRLCLATVDNGSGLQLRDGLNEVTGGGKPGETATLMANIVVKDEKGELTTIPKVSYLSFKGNGSDIVQNANYNGNITSSIEKNGMIFIPLQKCPVNPESINKEYLHPRLSVAISSVVPESMDSTNNLETNLTKESTNREKSVNNVGKFGGVALQIDQVGAGVIESDAGWAVTATTGNYDGNSGSAKVYISPKSLSIVAFMWCSSEKQP